MTSWTPSEPNRPQYEGFPTTNYPTFTPTTSASTDGAAIVVFLLALSSYFFWIAPAIVALLLAPAAKRRVRSSNGATKGLGLVTAGQILSIVALLIGALVLVGMAIS